MRSSYDRGHLESIVNQPQELLSLVVKGHFAVDALFNVGLKEFLPKADGLEAERIAFLLKADLLIALGVLNAQLRGSFAALNMVRNRLAHNPYTTFNTQSTAPIRDVAKQSAQFVASYADPSFNQLGPEDLIRQIIAVSYVYTAKAIDASRWHKAEQTVAAQMAKETVARAVRPEYDGMSVEEEFQARVAEMLKTLN